MPQTKNPIKRGVTEFTTYLPIKSAMGTAITVEINPFNAEPIPAICPMGSIAKARRFPNKNPIVKN